MDYPDAYSMYQFCRSSPFKHLDWLGLSSWGPAHCWSHMLPSAVFKEYFDLHGISPTIDVNEKQWGVVLLEEDEKCITSKGWDRQWKDWLLSKKPEDITPDALRARVAEMMDSPEFRPSFEYHQKAKCNYPAASGGKSARQKSEMAQQAVAIKKAKAGGAASPHVGGTPGRGWLSISILSSFLAAYSAYDAAAAMSDEFCKVFFTKVYIDPCDPALDNAAEQCAKTVGKDAGYAASNIQMGLPTSLWVAAC